MNQVCDPVQKPCPDISILMTAFNAAAFLGEAIESVLQQETSRSWELIFVDDGSQDETLAIAEQYKLRFPDRIFLFTHPDRANHGISAARNLALRQARGALLTFLDADDVWLPHHLETSASLLADMPEVTMLYGEAERWVEFDQPFNEAKARSAKWGTNYLPPFVPAGRTSGLLERGELVRWFREDESFVPCICAVMLRTDAVRDVGGFCEEFRGLLDDQAFHVKIALRYPIYAINVCLARYRQHEKSCCANARANHELRRREHRRFVAYLSEKMQNVS
jgi:glycosyltransferase involved in cell wall biosynthesis